MSGMTSKFLRTLANGIFIAALCLPTRAQEATKTAGSSVAEHTGPQKVVLPGVPNFGQVTPSLFRGAQPSDDGFGALAKMGVGIVVDLRGDSDDEREQVTKLGMEYVAIPSHCSRMTEDGVAKFLTLVRDHPDKKVFIHCKYGVDRTGMMVAAYRISQGWTAEESRREMESFGFTVRHRMVCPGLSSFESNFPSAFASSSAFENLRPSSALPSAQPAPSNTN
ncbi:MAG: tyrosine-protein phosphatase [Candidatus Acidiferrales bacterium]